MVKALPGPRCLSAAVWCHGAEEPSDPTNSVRTYGATQGPSLSWLPLQRVWLLLRFMVKVEGKNIPHSRFITSSCVFNNIRDDILWQNLGMNAGQLGNSVGSFIFWGLEHFVLAKVRKERTREMSQGDGQRVSVSWSNFVCQLWKLDKQWQTRLFKWTCHFWFSWYRVTFFKSWELYRQI